MSKKNKRNLEFKLPLPPSINVLYVYNRYTRQKVYKREGRQYLDDATKIVQSFVREHGLKPAEDFLYIDMHFVLRDKRADSHNYKKLIFDVMEHGGLVINDKFIMDRTQSISYDRENPHVVILVPIL